MTIIINRKRVLFIRIFWLLLLFQVIIGMTQQSEEDENKLNVYVARNPIGEQAAQQLSRKMEKNICKFFGPFKQYFQAYPVHYLKMPNPTYVHQQQHAKFKLSINRQVEYFRGSAHGQHIDEHYLEHLLEEQLKDRGLAEIHQNKSLLLGDRFVYAAGHQIYSLEIAQKNINHNINYKINPGINPKEGENASGKQNAERGDSHHREERGEKRHEFKEPILQIAQFKDRGIIVRCRYWIHLFDFIEAAVLAETRLREEITSMAIIEAGDALLISTYDQKNYRLYQWAISHNQVSCLKVCQSYYGINSMTSLNRREIILLQPNQLFIEDMRCRARETFRRIPQIGNDRYYCITQMSSANNEFVLGRAKFLDLFDVRKPSLSLRAFRHFCEESPPSCLLSFQWTVPVVIGYSPYPNGSSLLFDFSPSGCHPETLQVGSKHDNGPMLLFDSGKLYHGLHPTSVTPRFAQNILQLLHVDSSDGICLQTLERQANLDIIHLSLETVPRYPQQPCKRWIQQKQLEPYLNAKNDWSSSSQQSMSEQDEQSAREGQVCRKINYCSLDKFRQKIGELAKMRKGVEHRKQVSQYDNSMSTLAETLHDHKVEEILKEKLNELPPEHRITEQLLDFLAEDWKIEASTQSVFKC